MAGSYDHCVNSSGRLRSPSSLSGMLDTDGDVYEAIEEFYGMVWFLAEGDPALVEQARQRYQRGLEMARVALTDGNLT